MRTPSRHVGLRWAGLAGLGRLCVLYRVRTYIALTKLKDRCCCVRRVCLETLVSKEVPCRGLASRLILARRWNNRRLVGVHPTQRPSATGNTDTSLTPGSSRDQHLPRPHSHPEPIHSYRAMAPCNYCVMCRTASSSFVSPARTSPHLSTDALLLSSSRAESRVLGWGCELCADTPRPTSILSRLAPEHGSIVDTQRRLLENRAKDVAQELPEQHPSQVGHGTEECRLRSEWGVVRKRRHAARVVDSREPLSGQANQVCSETASAGYLAYHSRLGLGRSSGSAAVEFGRGVDRKSHRAACHHGIGSFRQRPLQLPTPSFLSSVPPACTATHRHATSILAIWMQAVRGSQICLNIARTLVKCRLH